MAERRNGCGCLLLLVILGAVVGGPTIFGKTEDAVVTAPANSGPSTSASTGSPPSTTKPGRSSTPRTKVAAPKTTTAARPPAVVPKTTAPIKSPRTAVPQPPTVARAAVPTYYANCTAARAAGAAPLYRGQPGYRSALDRDNDGVACET